MKEIIFSILFLMFVCVLYNYAQSNNQTTANDLIAVSQETDSEKCHIHIRLSKFAMAKDPVCNMKLKIHLADTASYNGKLYGFCSQECKEKFLKQPLLYLNKK